MSKITIGTLFLYAQQNGYRPLTFLQEDSVAQFVNESVTTAEARAIISPIISLNRHLSGLTPYDILILGYHPKDDEQLFKIVDFAGKKALEKMNAEFAMIIVGGKTRVLRECIDPISNAPSYELMTPQDLSAWCQSKTYLRVRRKDDVPSLETISIAKDWVSWSQRRQYPNGLVMDPSKPGEFDGRWNIFRGFPVEPVTCDWYLFDTLVRDVLCGGNEQHYEWLMDWMASMIQKPGERYGVALVLRGDKGTGKGRFAHYFGQLFSPHFVLVAHQDHLTGRFNAHFSRAILVCADELSWGGDKKREGVLKSMITEDTLMLEHKGIDSVPVKNNCRFIFTSNEHWAAPITPGERRFFVLDVDSHYKGNKNFWDMLDYQMVNGGLQGLMSYLMNRQITTNQRNAPHTKALEEIAINGLDETQKWLRCCLSMRGLYYRMPTFGQYNDWPVSATADDLYLSYSSYHENHFRGQPMAKEVFMRKIIRLLELPPPSKKTVTNSTFSSNQSTRRTQVYELPDIEHARKVFNRTTGMDFPWLDA